MPTKPKSPPIKRPSPTARKRLSPRGRGSVAATEEEKRLQLLFASNLRLVRNARGISQEVLGDASDLDRTYISGIERGLRNVAIQNIQRLADALTVDVRVLFDPELAKNPKYRQ